MKVKIYTMFFLFTYGAIITQWIHDLYWSYSCDAEDIIKFAFISDRVTNGKFCKGLKVFRYNPLY